jgi:FtsZ-interacting cell division protein YlmF
MQSIYTQKNGEHLSWPKAFLHFLLGMAPLETDSETDSEQNQSTRANHQSTRAPETDSEQTTRAPEHQRTRAPEEEEEEEEEEEVYRRRSAPRRCACRPPANCRSEIHAPGLQPGRLRAFYQQQQQRQCQNAISMYITYCSYIIHIAIFYTCG